MPRLKLAVGLVFYNDYRSLKRCLESIAGNVDYVFALDGRYNYDLDNDYFAFPLSTDGSREVVNCYKDQNVFLIDKPDLPESQKRQVYFELCRDYNVDLCLVMDSDEYVFCADWPKFYEECFQKVIIRDDAKKRIYNVSYRDEDRPRLFFKPWEVRYGLTHYEFYLYNDPTKALLNMHGNVYHLIEHIVLNHNHDLRDVSHIHAHEIWEAKQKKVEDHVRFGEDFKGLEHVKHADEVYVPC